MVAAAPRTELPAQPAAAVARRIPIRVTNTRAPDQLGDAREPEKRNRRERPRATGCRRDLYPTYSTIRVSLPVHH